MVSHVQMRRRARAANAVSASSQPIGHNGGPPLVVLEPITCTIKVTCQITGLSHSKVYEEITAGRLEAVKDGAKTLITYKSIKARQAALPRVYMHTPPTGVLAREEAEKAAKAAAKAKASEAISG